jgi:DNA-binding transcriptional MerR regulator
MEFSAAAAKKIVEVSQRCLDYWDERGVVRPSVRLAKGKGTERLYSFDDLLRLAVVKKLRAAGLSMQRVRKGLEKLRKRWPHKDPLLDEHLVTDGVSFFRVSGSLVEDVLADGQLVFGIIAVGRMRADLKERVIELRREGLPARGKRVG